MTKETPLSNGLEYLPHCGRGGQLGIPAAANAGDVEVAPFQEKRALVKQIWCTSTGFGEVDTTAAPR